MEGDSDVELQSSKPDRGSDLQDVIPHMAQEYGFDYDLVTYKWPSWLHKQTEKQRIIWAYKILFLDVLFPLSVKKVSLSLVSCFSSPIVCRGIGNWSLMKIKSFNQLWT